MAHPCCICGSECYCSGSLDDVIVDKTPKGCEGCGCQDFAKDQGWDTDDDYDEGPEFIPCERCDGHPACEDFGCAFELGNGKLVKTDIID
jgi:hypothetical protein